MTLWKSIDSWVYEVFDMNTPPSAFQRHESFVEVWSEKRKGKALPARADFDMPDFRSWLGWVTIMDLDSPDGARVRNRLWGSNVARITGLEMTDKAMQDELGERIDATNFNDTDLGFIRRLVEERSIGINTGPVNLDIPGYQVMSTIRLPLSNDGEQVHGFLSAVAAW